MEQWQAQWIWDDGDPTPVNAYRYFLKRFTPADGGETVARIATDVSYVLYVNGTRVAHGPAPSTPIARAYDVVELAPFLLPGVENAILAVVNYIGMSTFFNYRNRAGFLFEMGGIKSDPSWLVNSEQAWLAEAPKLTVQQGHAEYFDARLEPAGLHWGAWDLSAIDPTAWRAATVVSAAEGGPWPNLEARDIPLAWTEEIVNSIAVVEYGTGVPPADAPEVSERLTNEALRPLSSGDVTWLRDYPAIIKVRREGEDISILLDMGREVSGYFTLDVNAAAGTAGGVIEMGYDEKLRPGLTISGLKNRWPESSEVYYADEIILREGAQRFQNFRHRAFRFVRLAFRGFTGEVTLNKISMVESTYPFNRRGSFHSSDGRLNQIWEIGRRTLQLCMDDRFMDCPWRERAQWIGDAKVEAYGAQYCFGDTKLLGRMIRQIAESQYEDGRFDPVGPGEWDDHAPNRPIPGFMMIWIHTIWDYYLLTADLKLPARVLPAAEKALGWIEQYASPNGLLHNVHGWNFVDWAPGMTVDDQPGAPGPLNLLYLEAVRVVARVAEALGDTAKAKAYRAKSDTAAAAFEALFWDNSRGLYKDQAKTEDGQEEVAIAFSQHTNCLALLSQVGSEEHRAKALTAVLEDKSLTQIGSPYFAFYLLSTLYKYDRPTEALAEIRKEWGRMLDAGATTWWEEYPGHSSLCHAWSCGPTIDMQARILGVTPAAPGFTTVRVAPFTGDLEWAKGIIPIPQGQVSVSWRETESEFQLDITTPTTVTLSAVVPASWAGSALTLNGTPVAADSLAALAGGGYRIVAKR